MRFFCSLFGFRPSLSLPGDCLKMSSKARPEDVDGVPESDLSVLRSPLPPGGESKGVVSFLGVWYSRVMVEAVSLPTFAKGVVASLEDADVISGGAGNNVGAVDVIGVLCNDSCLGLVVSTAIADVYPGLGVDGSEPLSRGNRGEAVVLPPLREGTVLLRCTPEAGVAGSPTTPPTTVGPPSDRLLRLLLESEAFRLILPNFPTLSAPALALELVRPMIVFDLPGVVGVPGGCLEGLPLCTSRTVSGSAAVPCMPMRKLSWFSIKKMRTSWLRRYSRGAISCWG